jgi:hypothetical protein
MNANAVAKNYAQLTPGERWRLILAASGRGDEAERDRLCNVGGRITLSMSDHSPYCMAFHELALLTFIELLEDAARCRDAWEHHGDVCELCGADDEEEQESDDDAGAGQSEEAEEEPGETAAAERESDDAGEGSVWRSLHLALAAGYLLRAKADGWQLFCERLSIPPFLLVEGLPGFDRLQRALAAAGETAFTPEGFLRWLNANRPAGAPELTEAPLTAEGMASATEAMFRKQVKWWGG